MYRNNDFGKCSKCGGKLQPVFFEEKEIKVITGTMIYTGRKRTAVSHLTCENCMKNECVDDSFDGAWH